MQRLKGEEENGEMARRPVGLKHREQGRMEAGDEKIELTWGSSHKRHIKNPGFRSEWKSRATEGFLTEDSSALNLF
jgi:hypothetical protein